MSSLDNVAVLRREADIDQARSRVAALKADGVQSAHLVGDDIVAVSKVEYRIGMNALRRQLAAQKLRETPPERMREEVLSLVESMEAKLSSNRHKRNWKHYGAQELLWFFLKLREEVDELEEALMNGTVDDIKQEVADVCNFGLFIHDTVQRCGLPTRG